MVQEQATSSVAGTAMPGALAAGAVGMAIAPPPGGPAEAGAATNAAGSSGGPDPALQEALQRAANPSPELRSWVERARGAGMFTDLSETQLAAILAPGQLHHYKPGDIVIPYGDPSDSMFALLADGRVRIVTPINLPPPVGDWLSGEKSLIELPAPQVVGHMNLLASTTRSATVEAVSELDAIEVQRSHLEHLARYDLAIGYVLMRNIARSLQGLLRLSNQDVINLTVAVALAARALKK